MIQTITIPSTDAQFINSIHAILGDDRRRAAVDAIAEGEPPIGVRELARTISDRERTGASRSPDDIAATLHHQHLPTLDDAAVIDYDVETNTVTAAQTAVLREFVDGPDGNG